MINPLIANKVSRRVYIFIWLQIAFLHGAFLIFVLHQPLKESVLDSIVFNVIFASLGFNTWYVVKFAGLNPANVGNTLVTHFFSALVLITIWLLFGSGILNLVLGEGAAYNDFVRDSIYYRAAIGLLFYGLIVMNYYMALFYQEIQEQKLRESETNRLLKETELSMLKAQINPHFIFNSLNSVSSLTLTNPEKAHEMVINLASFLRYTIAPQNNKKVQLSEEINAIKQYLAVEQIRFGDRLNVSIIMDKELDGYDLPNMILQPLVENAIKYGVYESTEENKISIKCKKERDVLVIIIKNDIAIDSVPKKGKGIGLTNVKSRLSLIYGSDDLINIQHEKNQFTVTLKFPQ